MSASTAPGNTPPPLLHVDLRAGYGSRTVLEHLRFTLQPGERLGLVGTSGAGKSTLLLALLGLLGWKGGWVKGEVRLEGTDLLQLRERQARTLRGRRLALVPQSPASALNNEVSLGKHLRHAWLAHQRTCDTAFQQRVAALLHRVQLPADPQFLARKPGQISIGQAQRFTLVLALLHRPALIIADEPTSALDPCTQVEVLALLRQISEDERAALLFVSHDLLSTLRLCERLAVLDEGRLVEDLPVQDVGQATHPALLRLLRALPVPVDLLLRHVSDDASPEAPAGYTGTQPADAPPISAPATV